MNETHVAVLVLNRNMRKMTEKLIETIRKTCTPKHTIFSLDAASDPEQKTEAPGSVRFDFAENKRWAWSFAEGMDRAVKFEQEFGQEFTHFWLLCNDTQLDPSMDTLGILLREMPEDACQIHPFQKTYPEGSPQGWAGFNRVRTGRRTHNVAFVEFVCPLITRSFYDQCIANFGCPPVGPHFPYGWGVDYEMAYFGHQLKLKSYICDAVGITHHPGTTHLAHEQTKVEDNNRMRVLARNSMLDVLEARHGRDWGDKFANAARAAGVDPRAFLEWSQYDRALSARGARV